MSLLSPPFKTSCPIPPFNISSPAPPLKVSLNLLISKVLVPSYPLKLSATPDPFIISIWSCKVSVPDEPDVTIVPNLSKADWSPKFTVILFVDELE